jgi:hypothetical protein
MRPPYLRISEIDTIVAPQRLEDVGDISRSRSFPIQTYRKFGLFTLWMSVSFLCRAILIGRLHSIGKPFLYAFVGVAAHAPPLSGSFLPRNILKTTLSSCTAYQSTMARATLSTHFPCIIPIVDLIQGDSGTSQICRRLFSLSAPKTTEPHWIGSSL